jgi:hypothetical protein
MMYAVRRRLPHSWLLTFAMILSAQTRGSHSVGLVLPKADVPLCAHQIEEKTQRLPDGSVVTQKFEAVVCRDAAGRMRTDWKPSTPSGDAVVRPTLIVDPPAGFITVLDPVSRTAWRVSVPGSQPHGFGLSLPSVDGLQPDDTWKTVTESIGKRVIEGVEFEGIRITNVSGDQPPLRIVYEYWTSSALGLIGWTTASGPNGEHTAKLQDIERRIPGPEQFAIPPDYALRELASPN